MYRFFIEQWLKVNEFLKEEYSEKFKKNITIATEKGKEIGIRSEERVNSQGISYMHIIYERKAQEFIVQNMEGILNYEKENS